ncbi:S-methyl-5'-thioadenosine phosphorylase [Dactylosporangium aurantiacum]|uniref:Purine nucleoside phosphorylase n=1 Tax=Dactylosporangium aurantiacum TaxID=35754 RepID=A0A9Q9I7Z4_9ACTN|nr:S-methyl-5'-thioadenosine phosphorylase [Dactylosporangium aurantiacum]MDG6107075.1 S-methyl-5'-thioadenosine phosphorylase [Dactylosporangium aurantiacum]UWZ51374.1 S-methyl-5'-thioadenosine phosphorylase [Dactylosporangium aurantiacum]
MNPTHDPAVGVIGGTGFYALLDGIEQVTVDTPYGPPSGPVGVTTLDGRRVAFLARHGGDHRFPPHRINYRANLWALRSLGVRQIIAPSAVGSLRPELGPGCLVVPDQLVDRTTGRTRSFYDDGAVHVSFADPFCPVGRDAVLRAAARHQQDITDGGVTVVVDGPSFSTRAESRWYAAQGWTLVNMTAQPETVLARELALCYTSVALVTDLDAGIDRTEAVSQHDVFAVFAANIERLRAVVLTAVAALPAQPACDCQAALAGMSVPA